MTLAPQAAAPPGDRTRSEGNELVVVANRLPVRSVSRRDSTVWETSPGGLVSALQPVAAQRSTAWVGWTGEGDTHVDPFEHDGVTLHPVSLSRAEIQLYYEGFSNGTLWPLYHDAITPAEFHRTWWDAYVRVNRRFAESAAEAAAPGASVWFHDYHLQLAPALLRQLRPDVRIGWFLHIPFPPSELFLRMPWRVRLIEGLLGADLLGFQTPGCMQNFRTVVNRITTHRATGSEVHTDDRVVSLGTFPIGIDVARVDAASRAPGIDDAVRQLRSDLGDPQTVLLGVDRLDYTKGIEVRLRAYRELLDEGRLDAQDCVMVQIAEPSRGNVHGYPEIRAEIERLAGDINGNFGGVGRPAIHYLHQSQAFEQLVAMYRAADVMLVTPLRDGMNLVAKEYVCARIGERGVLVLSEFAGAARELRQALLVNPYDVDGVKEAIVRAVEIEPGEARQRMRSLRRAVRRNSAQHWADSFLATLEQR
ncbi:MAG: trehalose-6-phosphate synthase [Acidimicrobiales bacterium]|nr:trehalose-6-phosphate synthase [Acidimicrobiales bacterium]